MKRLLLHSIFLISFFLLTTTVSGQIFKGTVIAGGNLTQVEGDKLKGWNQFGFTGGVGVIMPIGKEQKWGINLETLFTQKGSFQKQQFESDSLTDEYRLRLNYFEVPLYVTFTDKDVLTFGLGGYYARLASAREEEHSGMQEPYMDSVPFNDSDWGFLIDVRVRIWQHLHVGVRYSQSLMSIRERTFSADDTRKQKNQVIAVRFLFIFNEGKREKVQGR